jgi:hypothetical protein
MENTFIAPQRMSYFYHIRFSRKVFTPRCKATITARIHRKHCCFCYVFLFNVITGMNVFSMPKRSA